MPTFPKIVPEPPVDGFGVLLVLLLLLLLLLPLLLLLLPPDPDPKGAPTDALLVGFSFSQLIVVTETFPRDSVDVILMLR